VNNIVAIAQVIPTANAETYGDLCLEWTRPRKEGNAWSDASAKFSR
jgi:hypothetical protein